jgi:hypothetical protein
VAVISQPAREVAAFAADRTPVLVTGEATVWLFGYELLVGFTRLGGLLGLIKRDEVSPHARH